MNRIKLIYLQQNRTETERSSGQVALPLAAWAPPADEFGCEKPPVPVKQDKVTYFRLRKDCLFFTFIDNL